MAHSGNPAGVSINITHSSSNDRQPTPKTPTEVAELFARLEDALIKQMEVSNLIFQEEDWSEWGKGFVRGRVL